MRQVVKQVGMVLADVGKGLMKYGSMMFGFFRCVRAKCDPVELQSQALHFSRDLTTGKRQRQIDSVAICLRESISHKLVQVPLVGMDVCQREWLVVRN